MHHVRYGKPEVVAKDIHAMRNNQAGSWLGVFLGLLLFLVLILELAMLLFLVLILELAIHSARSRERANQQGQNLFVVLAATLYLLRFCAAASQNFGRCGCARLLVVALGASWPSV
jgi:hypothetical protein